ncbi:MAG: hypothetical protein COB20_12190 [SAR86 cluster bacterium]|uniref:Uncharacterized protein n=1 Tax=SAR86 cluster bacterium TaxID=2030880 RepID=A0A2A4X112_9GAMM|nr:MAG: hypothetical protein COB20_12190 [SAR86 cluster bacterium]
MSSNFLNIAYQGEFEDGVACLLEPSNQSDEIKCYALLYVHVDVSAGYANLAALINQLRQTDFYKLAVFAFTSTSAGTTQQELKAFSNTLLQCAQKNESGSSGFNTQIVWFDDVTTIDQTTPPFISLTYTTKDNYAGLYVDASSPLLLGNAGGTSRFLSVDFSKASNSFLYCVENKLALACLKNSDTTSLAFGTQGNPNNNKSALNFAATKQNIGNGFYSYFTITMDSTDGLVGGIDFTGVVQPGFTSFNTSIQYSAIDDSNKDLERFEYPLMVDTSQIAQQQLSSRIDPLNPLNQARTYFNPGDAVKFTSSFRTLLGSPINLEPSQAATAKPAQFIFYLASNDYVYLSPIGDFATSLPKAEQGLLYKNNLLCGLSGTEYLQFTAGTDEFRFVPSQPATVVVSSVNNKKQVSNLIAGKYVSSWLRLVDANNDSRQYYSEPNGQPFYASSSNDEALLSYYPLTQNTMQQETSSSDQAMAFPIACYSALSFADTDDPAPKAYYEYFESQVLSTNRRNVITKICNPGPPPADGGYPILQGDAKADGFFLTPLGYRASVSGGEWTDLRFAQTSTETLELNKSTDWKSLPQPIQDAFLTNQQFMVVSVDSGSNLGVPSLNLNLAGWDFNLTPPPKEDQILGSYHNILIFKSCTGNLLQWITTPDKWTNYDDFNDTDSDPQGNYLSNWLIQYCNDAIAAFESGNLAFKNFNQLINDVNWNGFIALNVSIDVGNLDPALDPLLGGIVLSKFFAHHVGNEATRAQPQTSTEDFDLESSLFALIYYNDPGYNPSTGQVVSPQSNSIYDFKVLTLTALFLKSGIASFSSKLMLTINELFGSKVLTNTSHETFPATTRLLLDGSVQTRGGVSVYSFQTPPHSDNYFYLSSGALSAVEITQAEFSITSVSGKSTVPPGKAIDSDFKFWGNLIFGQGVNLPAPNNTDYFDIFSYERLAFSQLDLSMSFTLCQTLTDGESTFTKSPLDFKIHRGAITVSNQISNISDQGNTNFNSGSNYIREDSLLSQFPMKLKNFVVAATDSGPPSNMGYSNLTATPITKANMTGTISGEQWFGLEFEVELGAMGALAPSVIFTAELLFAWGATSGNLYTGIKLPGLGPPDKLINIEGIITFGSKAIVFDRVEIQAFCNGSQTTKLAYVINFASIGLHILSLSYPPAGSTNVSIFGNPCSDSNTLPSNVGWFGSYIKPGTKPIDPPPSLTKDD